jgi:hypothetical protein
MTPGTPFIKWCVAGEKHRHRRDSTIVQYQALQKLLPLVGVLHQQGNTKHRAEDWMKGLMVCTLGNRCAFLVSPCYSNPPGILPDGEHETQSGNESAVFYFGSQCIGLIQFLFEYHKAKQEEAAKRVAGHDIKK